MNHYKFVFYVLILGGLLNACKFSKLLKSTDLREKYTAALKYYEKGDYYKTSVLLEELIPLIRGTKEQEIAQFYYAYCAYYQKAYTQGAYFFKKFYQTFRSSQFAEEARFMETKCMYKDSPPYNLDQGNTTKSIRVCQQFLNSFPESKYFEECNTMMNDLRIKLERKAFENANLYYRISEYKAAVIAFNNFQQDFPDSQEYSELVAFLKLDAQYELAKLSFQRLKQERFQEAIEHYEYFISNYAQSKRLKAAEDIYDKCVRELGKLSTVKR